MLLLLYSSFGALAYSAFGDDTSSVVLLNLPDQRWTCAVQMMYVIAVALTYPIQLFPAIKVAEHLVFKRGGAVTTARKWRKNVVRAELLDNFVALIGSLCCLPLALIYPPLFTHLLRPQRRIRQKALGLAVMASGGLAMGWTVYQTLATWSVQEVPTRCDIRHQVAT
eukprot:Polyplicarium_translucidae@DN2822_c0_g1_i2.p1